MEPMRSIAAIRPIREDAMKRLAADNPKDFVKVAAMVVPKEIDLDVTETRNLFAE